jgi:hypothetical protein
MSRKSFTERFNNELTGKNSNNPISQTQVNKNRLAKIINNKLYILNDKSLKDEITKNLKDNKLSLPKLTNLNTQLDFIENNPADCVSYYSNLYFMFKLRNPFSHHNVPMY